VTYIPVYIYICIRLIDYDKNIETVNKIKDKT
jgi:hypothetical protein